MAVSRPLLLTLVGAMLMAATFMAARGARTAADPVSQAAVVQPAPNAAKGKSAGAKPADADAKGAKKAEAKAEAAKARAEEAGAAEAKAKARAKAAKDKAAKADANAPAKVVGLPTPVANALANKKVVVLFFFQNAADDDATGAAVNSLRDIRGVKIFKDAIVNLAKYRAVTAALGVTQAPAVVVVGRDRNAQLLEGFVDRETLSQIVVDAR